MKKSLLRILFILIAVLILAQTAVFAANETIDEIPELKIPGLSIPGLTITEVTTTGINTNVEPKTYDNDHFEAQQTLSLINVTIQGNAFLAGQQLNLSNVTVTGSAFIAGQTVNVSGLKVTGSIFIAGQDVNISETTAKNIYAAGNNLNIANGTKITKNAYVGCSNFTFDGTVENLDGGFERARFLANTNITGNCNISAESEPSIDTNAKMGNMNFNKIEVKEIAKVSIGALIVEKIMGAFKFVLFNLLIAIIILKLMSGAKERIQEYSIGKTALNALWGLLALIGIPFAAIILMCTGILLRAGGIAILAYLIMCFTAKAVGTFVISILIAKKMNIDGFWKILLTVFVVSLILEVIELIPVLGGLTLFAVLLIGLGEMITKIAGKFKKEETKPVEVKE